MITKPQPCTSDTIRPKEQERMRRLHFTFEAGSLRGVPSQVVVALHADASAAAEVVREVSRSGG